MEAIRRFLVRLTMVAGLLHPGKIWSQVVPNNDKFFSSAEACLAGARNYYTPVSLSGHNKNLPDGKTIVVEPLESDACVYMRVVGRYAWVWQKSGDKFRWRKNANGTMSIMARHDCGNDAPSIAYPKPNPAPRSVGHAPEPSAPRTDTIVVIHKQASPFVFEHQGSLASTQAAQQVADYQVRGRANWWKRGAISALIAGAGYGIYALASRDGKDEKPAGKPPGGHTGPAFSISF